MTRTMVLACLLGVVLPASTARAVDNDQQYHNVVEACQATYEACKEACNAGAAGKSAMNQQIFLAGCLPGCDSSHKACLKSAPDSLTIGPAVTSPGALGKGSGKFRNKLP